jgi:hypothetical protein
LKTSSRKNWVRLATYSLTAVADARGEHCYTGNSHVKPMLQIIDNAGGFHGWVAVEASLNQTSPSQGTWKRHNELWGGHHLAGRVRGWPPSSSVSLFWG